MATVQPGALQQPLGLVPPLLQRADLQHLKKGASHLVKVLLQGWRLVYVLLRRTPFLAHPSIATQKAFMEESYLSPLQALVQLNHQVRLLPRRPHSRHL